MACFCLDSRSTPGARPAAPSLFYAVAHLSLSRNVVAHHHRTIEKSTLSSFRHKCAKNMCFTIKFYSVLASATQSRPRDKLQSEFCSCVTFLTRLWLLGCVVERAHLKSSAGVKLNRFRYFAFTCRSVETPDLGKYVLGRGVTIG